MGPNSATTETLTGKDRKHEGFCLTFNQKLLNSQGNILLAIKLILNWQDLVSKRATVIINMYTQHVINNVQVPFKTGRFIRGTLQKCFRPMYSAFLNT